MNIIDSTCSRPSESSSDSGIMIEEIKTKIDRSFGKLCDGNIATNLNHSNYNSPKFIRKGSFHGSDTQNNNCTIENYAEAKNCPTLLNNHNIAVESVNDSDSSVIDSDSDNESSYVPENSIVDKLGRQASVASDGLVIVNHSSNSNGVCNSSSTVVANGKPQIGSIAVQNSSDITFGNKTFYQGPVTIKQFLLDNKNKWQQRNLSPGENPSFEASGSSDDIYSGNCEKGDILADETRCGKFVVNSKSGIIIGIIIAALIIIGAIIFTTISLIKVKQYKPGDGDDSRKNIPINSTIGDDIIGAGKGLRIISRDEWLAQPPNNELDDLDLPVSRVIIAHTATENCTNQATCTFRVRFIQTFHMESRGWDDIAYNFMVGGDGAAYAGRGWDKVGAHTKSFNIDSICIAFIGTFTKNVPPVQQLQITQLLIEEGIRLKKIKPDYKLFGHRQFIPSESPGAALYEIIKTWPHWSAVDE